MNATDDMERSALTWAGRLGHAGACKRLLGAGADVNHASDMRTTDLMQAARAGLENVVREMASRGAGVDVSEGGTGWLEEGEGRTALMHAALGGQPGCVRALLDAGARASKRSAILATALHFAAKGGSAEAVRMLLLAGCDANQRDAVGLSPLCYAMEGPASCEAVLEELVRGGADLGWVNQDGMTALMVAARVRNAEAVRFLLAKGANCSATDNKGRTALMYAAQWHVSEEVVDVLLEAGVDVDAVDRDGRNAAAYGAPGRLGSMGVFAERGSDVTLVGSDGESALSIAARRGDHESVRAALACGAVGACTKAGERAMRIALEHGCWGVVTALLDYGASAEGARRHLADAAGASDGELDALESVRHTLSRI